MREVRTELEKVMVGRIEARGPRLVFWIGAAVESQELSAVFVNIIT